jgi:general secretion pathway protein F
MTRFQYRAMTLDGRETAGEAEAADALGLADALSPRGLMLIEAKPLTGKTDWRGWFATPARKSDVTNFLSELALMLHSGQTIDEALSLLSDGMTGAMGRIMREMRSDLLKGTSFVEALAHHGETFPPEVLALVRVAESTGKLDRAIEAAVQQRVRTEALTEKLTGALRYPAFLFLAAIGVLVFFLLYVIPQFADVIRDSGGKAGGAITGVLAASDLLRNNLDVAGGALAVLLGLALWASRSKAFGRAVMSRLLRLPFVRQTADLRRSALFCMTLGTLLGQGVPVPEALKVLEAVIGGAGAEALSRIGDQVRRGGGLGDALETHAFLPKIARRMLKIGEESGELATVASRCGALYEKKLEQRLDAIAALVGPIAVIGISSLIGGLMAIIMSALVSINQLAT